MCFSTVAAAGEKAALEPCEDSTLGTPTLRKFNPGHYVSMNRFDTRADLSKALRPGVAGAQIRYRWSDLEPTLDAYNLTEIAADLEVVAKKNVHLVVFIEDKSFDGELPTPAYLRDGYTLKNRNGGYTAKRWDPYVAERLNRLTSAIGEKFNCHPNFEGIAFQESALSLETQTLNDNGYSAEQYKNSLINILRTAAESAPNSQVFWYMNFLPQKQHYIAEIAAEVSALGVAIGGPDILPDRFSLKMNVYPFYSQFKDRMTLFSSMQYDSYAHEKVGINSSQQLYWTLEELFVFARDTLHVSYIFWNRKTWRRPAGSYDWSDAVTVIEENPTFNTRLN